MSAPEIEQYSMNRKKGLPPEKPDEVIVLALRLWTKGRQNWWSIVSALRQLVGEDNAAEPLLGLRGVLETLTDHSRARLVVHDLEELRLSAHERSLLTLIAALQLNRRDHAALISTWLVPRAERGGILGHARLLADRLKDAGAIVEMPPMQTCAPTAPNGAPCKPVPD